MRQWVTSRDNASAYLAVAKRSSATNAAAMLGIIEGWCGLTSEWKSKSPPSCRRERSESSYISLERIPRSWAITPSSTYPPTNC